MRVRRAWGRQASPLPPAAVYTRSAAHPAAAAAAASARFLHAAAPAPTPTAHPHIRPSSSLVGGGVRRAERAAHVLQQSPGRRAVAAHAYAWTRLQWIGAAVAARFSSLAAGAGATAGTGTAAAPTSSEQPHASDADAIPLPAPPQPLTLGEHAEPVEGTATAASSAAADADTDTELVRSNEDLAALAAAEAAEARAHAEAEAASYAPIPTGQPDAELKGLEAAKKLAEDGGDAVDPAASLPKLPSSDTLIRGTLWFDNMYPMRVHVLDIRYLVATHNHDVIIPRVFAKAFGRTGFRLLGATPRANEGGVFVHFEVARQGNVRTPEDVTAAIIKLLRKNPVHARLTPKAVRCHLVRGRSPTQSGSCDEERGRWGVALRADG